MTTPTPGQHVRIRPGQHVRIRPGHPTGWGGAVGTVRPVGADPATVVVDLPHGPDCGIPFAADLRCRAVPREGRTLQALVRLRASDLPDRRRPRGWGRATLRPRGRLVAGGTGSAAGAARVRHGGAVMTGPPREHIDAVARALLMGFHDMVCPESADCRCREVHAASYGWFDATGLAGALLTCTDPAVRSALAAALPDDVLVAEARRRGIWRRSRCACAWCCNDVPAGQAGHVHLRTCPAQKGATT